jgi:hypothetical protein
VDKLVMTHPARLARHGAVSTALALLSDRRLSELVEAAPLIGSGIGGTAVSLEVEGWPVFVKRVPLTDLERRPDNVMTTNWVLGGRCAGFPLMYHWRVLPGPAPVRPDRLELERTVEYWGGSPAVRERLAAIADASAGIVLFLERIPTGLRDWLAAQVAAGPDRVQAACAMVERELRSVVPFMNANGLAHFDAHLGNLLTDGERLYLGDLGLATSHRFELSAPEREFLRANLSHDGCHTVTLLINWLVAAVAGITGVAERNEYIRRGDPDGLPEWAAALFRRYAPVAVVMNDFYWRLFGESRATPYPVDDIQRACTAAGFEPVAGLGPLSW